MKKLQNKYVKKYTCKCKNKRIFFLLPSLFGVLLFALIPFMDVVRRSFTNVMGKKFIGFENYQKVIINEAFRLAVINEIRFIGIGLPLLLFISFMLALLLWKMDKNTILKSSYLFPMAVPTASVVFIWKVIFGRGGLLGGRLLEQESAFWVLIVSYLWKNIGYTVVLWLAGLMAISKGVLESAKVDGAKEWQCIWYIVIPMLKPMIFTVTILSFLNSFQVFRETYLVAGAYPQRKMYLLQHLFMNWFMNLEIEKLSAATVLIVFFFIFFVRQLQKKWEAE